MVLMSTPKSATEDAEKGGFDLSLMDASLSYSYEKRAIQHQEALNLALELERVGREPFSPDAHTRLRCEIQPLAWRHVERVVPRIHIANR